ncbi:MAG: Cation-independent mannose-6-phosphate receptor CI-MPR [Claussenomyces sp. TS43310]|nr:MAG: Cation-independent mannose-6-phosphate receptor CI-MPR [Claussenomyces sp. TS43310]
MHLPSTTAVLIATWAALAGAAADDKKAALPCTAHSTKSGSFFDLTSLSLSPPEDGKDAEKGDKTESWRSSGYDYGSNFTMNFCAPVLETLDGVEGVQEAMWRNVSAYYEKQGKIYSIGQESSNLTFRGRKLVLQYTNGSPCGKSDDKRSIDFGGRVPSESSRGASPSGRKSTIISFHCEKDPLATLPVTSFVGTDPDECAYFFEVRSQAACGGAEPVEQGIGPGGVFGIIVLITVLVYFIGGIMYQRSVAHARGWRQLPNYSMWAGIGGFFKDMFIIATSSCARLVLRRRGYSSISANGNGSSRGRGEDENRLIDQLDEEWDD